MIINVDCKSLHAAIKTCKAITGGTSAVLKAVNKKGEKYLTCSASGKDNVVEVVVLGEIISDSGLLEFGFDHNVVAGLTRGRTSVTFTYAEPKKAKKKEKVKSKKQTEDYDDSQVFFVSKAANNRTYDGNFAIVPGEDINFESMKGAETALNIDDNLRAALDTALSKVGVTDIFTGSELDLWVDACNNEMHVACFDGYHIAHSLFELDVKHDTKFNLPFSTFSVINELANGEKYEIRVSDSHIFAYNSDFKIMMPLLQDSNNRLTIQNVIDTSRSFNQDVKPDAKFTIQLDELSTTLDNISAIHEDGIGFELIVTRDGVKFHMKTGYGEVNDNPLVGEIEIASKKDKEVRAVVNRELLADTLSAYRGKGSVTLNLSKQHDAMWFTDSSDKNYSTYICLLL